MRGVPKYHCLEQQATLSGRTTASDGDGIRPVLSLRSRTSPSDNGDGCSKFISYAICRLLCFTMKRDDYVCRLCSEGCCHSAAFSSGHLPETRTSMARRHDMVEIRVTLRSCAGHLRDLPGNDTRLLSFHAHAVFSTIGSPIALIIREDEGMTILRRRRYGHSMMRYFHKCFVDSALRTAR